MNRRWILAGKIVRGAGEASFFTGLAWVRKQCLEKLSFSPYPGTLNIELDADCLPILEELQKGRVIEIISPDPGFCNAKSLPAMLGGERGAVIIPGEGVNIHGKNILEIISPLCLKETLSLKDGDRVEVIVTAP